MNRLPLPIADKGLGQHFLKDKKIIDSICQDFLDSSDGILEIGPGPGILTESLSQSKKEFFVIEMDTRFLPYLTQFIDEKQITFHDALKVNLAEFIKMKYSGSNLWLVSNLPYNVGSPLLINFLQTPSIKYMTLMFQKEVADKVFPFQTSKNYMNSLLVLAQSYFECELLAKVSPGAFTPPPKVDSAVLSMKRREIPLIPLEEFLSFEKFLRFMFSQKRKQLGGLLKSHYSTEKLNDVFTKLQIPLTIRAEALSLENVLALYRMLK